MEFNKEELELLDFSVELSIQCMNKVPARILKRKQMNKTLLVGKLNRLLSKIRGRTMLAKINLIIEKIVVDFINKRKKEKDDEEYFERILEGRKIK